jgi:hypothetical protein
MGATAIEAHVDIPVGTRIILHCFFCLEVSKEKKLYSLLDKLYESKMEKSTASSETLSPIRNL